MRKEGAAAFRLDELLGMIFALVSHSVISLSLSRVCAVCCHQGLKLLTPSVFGAVAHQGPVEALQQASYHYTAQVSDAVSTLAPAPALGIAAVAGALVGYGSSMGSGCTSGHGVVGLARLSPRSFVAVGTFMSTGVLAATASGYAGLQGSPLSLLEMPYATAGAAGLAGVLGLHAFGVGSNAPEKPEQDTASTCLASVGTGECIRFESQIFPTTLFLQGCLISLIPCSQAPCLPLVWVWPA